MKAIIQNKYGLSNTLELVDVEKPRIKDGEVMIEVHSANIASGDMRINTLDVPFGLKTIMRLIFGWNAPRNKIRGMTASGKIVEIGKDVTRFEIGDRVNLINSMGAGCLAEYICLSEKKIISKIGDNISYAQSAPVAFGAMSAYHFINEKTIHKGDKVLIYGASGSVGTYAVQLAIYYGGEVTAVCSKKNHEAMIGLGAKHVIDYQVDDFSVGKKKYDVILDAVIKLKKKDIKNVLTENGRYLTLKMPTKEKIERLDEMNRIMNEGKMISLMDKEFTFDEFVTAHNLVYSKHKVGNVVINIK